jgi:hypothetical protein
MVDRPGRRRLAGNGRRTGKLGAHSRIEALRIAEEKGWL